MKCNNISTAQMGRYISGHFEPSLKNAIKLCVLFNCSLDYLFGLDSAKNSFGKLSSPNFDIFLERYYMLLKEKNLSHKQVSSIAGFNRNNLVYWKQKRSFPTMEILYNLSNCFKTPIEYIIGRTNFKNKYGI